MKKILLITLFISSFSYSQTLKGIVSFNAKKSVSDETELSEKAKKPFIYSYIYSNQVSLQELISEEKTSVDTTIVEHSEVKGLTQETVQVINRPSKTSYYKNTETDVYRLMFSMNAKNVSIKDAIPVYDWNLQNETETIIGYSCKKATTERILFGRKQYITAWYTEDIPINSGPMDFTGLPGLILQIEIGDMSVTRFEKLKFIKDLTSDIEEPKNESKILSINEYQLNAMRGN